MTLVTETTDTMHDITVNLTPGLSPAVITVAGADRPGVSGAFFRVLSAYRVQLLDVEQSLFRGRLNLAALVGINADRADTLTEGLTETLKAYGQKVTVDDPWGYGNSLEWATSCPPPRHNFVSLPRIRSERPAFELHYPHMVERMRAEAHVGRH